MPTSDLFSARAKEGVTRTIGAIEGQTAAEVVVAVRHKASADREVAFLTGFIASFLVLLVLLFHPHEFLVGLMPVLVLIGFVFGEQLGARVRLIGALLPGRKARAERIQMAARSAFVELGVSRTRGRTGVLVFVSTFDRAVAIVVDTGVHLTMIGRGWEAAVSSLEAAVRRGDLDAFLAALLQLGPPLGALLPRSADDVNELSDDLSA